YRQLGAHASRLRRLRRLRTSTSVVWPARFEASPTPSASHLNERSGLRVLRTLPNLNVRRGGRALARPPLTLLSGSLEDSGLDRLGRGRGDDVVFLNCLVVVLVVVLVLFFFVD